MDRLEERIDLVREDWEEELPDSIILASRHAQDSIFENLSRAVGILLGMGNYLVHALGLERPDNPGKVFGLLAEAGVMRDQGDLLDALTGERQAVADGDLKVVVNMLVCHLDDIIDAGQTLLDHAPDVLGEPGTGLDPLIAKYRATLLALAACHGLTNLRVYGSMARGDADESSDVNLLVCAPPELDFPEFVSSFANMKVDVECLLQRRVDLSTDNDLLPAQRKRILEEAIAL